MPHFFQPRAVEYNCHSVKLLGSYQGQQLSTTLHLTEQNEVIFGCKFPASVVSPNSCIFRSDWTLDITHPAVDTEEGWQYAQSFDDPDEKWTAEMPIKLNAISNGLSGLLYLGYTAGRSQLQWVRRRRWVRIMRRRLDIPPSPFLEPDGAMYHLDIDGCLIPYVEKNYSNSPDPGEGQELGAMYSNFLASAQDYVSRARYFVGNLHDWDENKGTSIEIRRAIAKLERATTELRQGILSKYQNLLKNKIITQTEDDDTDRKTQAEVLLHTYSRDLERRRLLAGARGLLLSDAGNAFFVGCLFLAHFFNDRRL